MAAAAAGDPAEHLQNEATCSICLDYFQDPMMIIECGHNFCRACIDKYRQGSGGHASCPECRKRFSWKNLTPNRHLRNMVEATKQLGRQPRKSPEAENVCREHRKALTLFCKKDETLVCATCERSKVHRNHHVVCTEAAAADYKVKLIRNLQNLKKERSRLLSVKSNGEQPSLELLSQTRDKKHKAISEFQQLQKFLEDHQQRHLAKLCDLEREIEDKRSSYAKIFEDELSFIDALIGDIEEKTGQSADVFLKDIGSILDRCEKKDFQLPPISNSAECGRLKALSQENESLVTAMKRTRDNFWKSKWIKENVLLDPETAHPRYVVSADQRSVSWGDIRQEFPYNRKRFEYARCVLGTKGFVSGKHYWTVDVEDGDNWAVGVARESVEREEEINFEPDEGIWAMALSNDQYKVLTSPPLILSLENDPEEIQVSLNYDAGVVSFYDAEDKTLLYSFKSVDFEGERVFPFFRIVDSSTCLSLCS